MLRLRDWILRMLLIGEVRSTEHMIQPLEQLVQTGENLVAPRLPQRPDMTFVRLPLRKLNRRHPGQHLVAGDPQREG